MQLHLTAGKAHLQRLHVKCRHNGSSLEQVWVVAHLRVQGARQLVGTQNGRTADRECLGEQPRWKGTLLVPPATKQGSHLAQLHEAVHDAQEVAAGQRGARVAAGHVLLVQLALALGQPGDKGAANGAVVRPVL